MKIQNNGGPGPPFPRGSAFASLAMSHERKNMLFHCVVRVVSCTYYSVYEYSYRCMFKLKESRWFNQPTQVMPSCQGFKQ